MTIGGRTSRADRRKRTDGSGPSGVERRKGSPITDVTLRSQVSGDELQVFVGSPITADNCSAARTALLHHAGRADKPTLVLDLERCGYMDTPGLSLVFELRKVWKGSGKEVVLQNPSRPVQRILNITGMHRVFRIRQTSVDLERIPGAKAAQADAQTIMFRKE